MENIAATGRQNSTVGVVSVGSEGGEEHCLPFKVEDSVCSEPHLEVDTEEEPKTVPIQETGQT